MATPNFFSLANSELSQDAFLLYLLEWANPKAEYIRLNGALHSTGEAFVSLLLNPPGCSWRIPIASVTYTSQENNIDILALITDTSGKQYAVIIEDKTDTCAHDDQLVRYSKYVKEKYKNWELHCVYLKTGNESKHSLEKMKSDYLNNEWVKKNDPFFKIILREDLLEIFNRNCFTSNRIALDFKENLERIQKLTETYARKDRVVGAWGNTAWQGFYRGLEEKIDKSLWDNTHRPVKKNSRGIVLSGWVFKMPKLSIVDDNSVRVYLNLCLSKLTLKVSSKSDCHAISLTNIEDLNGLLSEYGLKLEVPKTSKCSLATFTRLDGGSFIDENDSVDIDLVVERLTQLQNLLPIVIKHIVMK